MAVGVGGLEVVRPTAAYQQVSWDERSSARQRPTAARSGPSPLPTQLFGFGRRYCRLTRQQPRLICSATEPVAERTQLGTTARRQLRAVTCSESVPAGSRGRP